MQKMDDLTSTNVATIASSESPWSTWIEKRPSNIYQNWPKNREQKNCTFPRARTPSLGAKRKKSKQVFPCSSRSTGRIRHLAYNNQWGTTIQHWFTCQRGVQEHLVSASRTFEKLILGLGCLFAAHLPSENAKKSPKLKYIVQANLHQFLLLEAQLFRTQLFPEYFYLKVMSLYSLLSTKTNCSLDFQIKK